MSWPAARSGGWGLAPEPVPPPPGAFPEPLPAFAPPKGTRGEDIMIVWDFQVGGEVLGHRICGPARAPARRGPAQRPPAPARAPPARPRAAQNVRTPNELEPEQVMR
jgi:hypothetical protein